MRTHLRNLFWHHHENNHKPRILHLSSLTVLLILVFVSQIVLSVFTRLQPGVLGFASHISPDEVINLTNQQRLTVGLPELRVNGQLAQAAAAKAYYMFANNFWAHNAPDGTTPWFFIQQTGYGYRYAGENLARDFNDSGGVVNAWMNSPTHRDNIVSDRYDEIGVAVVNGVLAGQETTLVVQMFGRPSTAVAVIPEQAVQTEVVEIPTPPETVSASKWQVDTTVLSQGQVEQPEIVPVLSAFNLTKSLNLALLVLLITVLAIDGWLVWHRQTVRISGKSFIHLSFLALIAVLIWFSQSGNVL